MLFVREMEAPGDALLFKGVLFVFFSNFAFGVHGFYVKKLRIIQLIFELARGRKFSGEQ